MRLCSSTSIKVLVLISISGVFFLYSGTRLKKGNTEYLTYEECEERGFFQGLFDDRVGRLPKLAKIEDQKSGFDERLEVSCQGRVRLENILDQTLTTQNIFFIESGPKETISGRESCALESAYRESGLHVVMVRRKEYLDLSDNTTCNMYHRTNQNLSILYADFASLAKGTRMEGFFENPELGSSPYNYTHTADAARVLLVYKYGGFYADTDYVILRSLQGIENVVAGDDVSMEVYNDNCQIIQGGVSNAMFHFDRGHQLLTCAMDQLMTGYKPDSWAGNGPLVLQACLAKICGMEDTVGDPAQLTSENMSRERCEGVQLLHYESFYPVGWRQVEKLYEDHLPRVWELVFDSSHAVHFYNSQTDKVKQITREKKKKTGVNEPALLTLARKHCPVSLYSVDTF